MTDEATKAAGEPFPVGKDAEAQRRNAKLLSGYDYSKYPTSITGYTGQDLQRVAAVRYHDAVRTRIGPRGNYKAGFARLGDGKLLAAVCRAAPHPKDTAKTVHHMYVYESLDTGLTWTEICEPGMFGKEPSLTALPDGSVLMTAQNSDFMLDESQRGMYLARSEDGGRTWDDGTLPGARYPRNVVVEENGSLLLLRPTPEWNLQLCRSEDAGRNWSFSEGAVDWDEKDKNLFDEVSCVRLPDGRLLAALRREIPNCQGEGFEDTMSTHSADNGRTWSRPVRMVNTAEVHVYLTRLSDGRILATYSNYHLPYSSCAILSADGGKTWDRESLVQLSLSADIYVGWAVTLELPEGDLITCYATTTYVAEPPDRFTCEVVRWRLPD